MYINAKRANRRLSQNSVNLFQAGTGWTRLLARGVLCIRSAYLKIILVMTNRDFENFFVSFRFDEKVILSKVLNVRVRV
jgi:hypothetical protein